MIHYDVIIVGGGAAGFFTAINTAQLNSNLRIAVLERGKEVLSKVRISGGGRCNVTHAEFHPKVFAENYPRGQKELLGPFHHFMSGDTIAWFADRGVELKVEEDGRMFPVTDQSQTIIDCFLNEAERLGISLETGQAVRQIVKQDWGWELQTLRSGFTCDKLVIATGSNPKTWNMLGELGHSLVPAVPSLFTFNIKDSRIRDLSGISVNAEIQIEGSYLESQGPLLITHWGMSGPAILKLSAWGARSLHASGYKFKIRVNWIPGSSSRAIFEELIVIKKKAAKQKIIKYAQFDLPKRLWVKLVLGTTIDEELVWANSSKAQLEQLAVALTGSVFDVDGKSTFKEEFVTAGGVDLREIDFKRFGSKKYLDLFLVGEVLDIDALTGGFNFQNAWTGGFIAAKAIAEMESYPL